MKRGEVCWFTFRLPDKRRPVLVLTRNDAIPMLNTVTVAPVTSTVRGVKSELVLGVEDGMPRFCAANFHQLQTVPRDDLGERIVTLSTEKMKEADRALCYALGVSEPDGKQVAEASAEYDTGVEIANAATPEGMREEDEWVGVKEESELL